MSGNGILEMLSLVLLILQSHFRRLDQFELLGLKIVTQLDPSMKKLLGWGMVETGPVLVLVVRGVGARAALDRTLGPERYSEARVQQPDSLRSIHGIVS